MNFCKQRSYTGYLDYLSIDELKESNDYEHIKSVLNNMMKDRDALNELLSETDRQLAILPQKVDPTLYIEV
eukprot:CAMPEP_0201284492 /NCGR_PEP_ID=MMETSP1317-20130820/75952_1 /ASSEMBLY_ACC=CAM_ASM_000770 /TAXON_ID=187299 /ORGANISM="Undescribed Undescribed, Strain Undescribed" /LENGTH=70 /DNA_ID=CAMNT_0047604897 /DNA_START=60 /DNA_END=272 /DNA_ORIENTATION=-